MRTGRGILLHAFASLLYAAANAGPAPPLQALPNSEKLVYRVSYQGVLTVGLPVEIARATLQLDAETGLVDGAIVRRASLQVSTEPFPRMEALYPFRYTYQSWFDPALQFSLLVSLRRDTSTRRHELIWFDRKQGLVHSYRTEHGGSRIGNALPQFIQRLLDIERPQQFRKRRVLELPEVDVLDRMSMLYELRNRSLLPGQVVELPVSDGKELAAYRILVEAREAIDFFNRSVPALRLRLTPVFHKGDDRGYAVRVWLSDDERRIPLRFHSSKFGGAIELRLTSMS